MEELQSTENLDREILEDARKKAYRILKTADDTIKTKSAEWDKKTSETIDELRNRYSVSAKKTRNEIMAVLPLDKRRIKIKKIEGLLNSAIETWYDGLNRKGILEIIENELRKRLDACSPINSASHVKVFVHKIEKTEAESILQTVLPGVVCEMETFHCESVFPELILETPDLKLYASVGKAVNFILDEKRTELIEALLGEFSTVSDPDKTGGGEAEL